MSLNNNMENMTKCEELKTGLESIETLKKEFDFELEKVGEIGTENLPQGKKALARAKELKAELDEKLEEVTELLGRAFFSKYAEMTSGDLEGMESELNRYRKNGLWGAFSTRAMKMKILDPNYDLKLRPEDWKGMENQLNEYRKKGMWGNFGIQAMEMRILDPNYDLNLGEEEWKGMENQLNEYRKKGMWANFGIQAMGMRILSSPRLAHALAEGKLNELK